MTFQMHWPKLSACWLPWFKANRKDFSQPGKHFTHKICCINDEIDLLSHVPESRPE